MTASLIALIATLRSTRRSRLDRKAEILALRHPLAVFHRQAPRRPRRRQVDRLRWVLRSRRWPHGRRALQIVTPATVGRWHRRACALAWSWTSRRRRPGRPTVAADLRTLIPQMRAATPLWGAPRIHSDLRKRGIEIAQATVAQDLARDRRRPGPPSQTWRTFLAHHVSPLASIDVFTVPTATCRVWFVVVVLAPDRRRIVHVNVTAQPTAAWTAHAMGLEAVVTAPRALWQHPFVARLIGSLRRDGLDHVIVWNERALRRWLEQDLASWHAWRTPRSLDTDAPVPRAVPPPPGRSAIVHLPHRGGVHPHDDRRAA